MESDPDTRHSWTNTSANLSLLAAVAGEEQKDRGVDKQACSTQLLLSEQDRNNKRKRVGSDHGEDCNCASSSTDEGSTSSGSEYTDSDSDSSGADEPVLKRNKVGKSDTESQPSTEVLDPPPPVIPKVLSPRSFNRELLKSVTLEDLSDLSSVSSLTSDGYSDLITTPRAQARQVEYEPPSPPVNQNPIEDCDSSSDLEDEDQVELERLVATSSDSDSSDEAENFADEESDSDDFTKKSFRSSGLSSDSEISEKDMWNCNQCNVKTNKPYLRYCLRCFRIRRNWLPKRPKSRKVKPREVEKAKPELKHHPNSLEDSSEEEEPSSTPEEPKFNQSLFSSTQESKVEQKADLNLSDKLQYILDAPPLLVKKTVESHPESERDVETCSICMVRDKNAAFVHGKSAHVYSCYTCADKILKKSGRCPICRKKILRVVRVISA